VITMGGSPSIVLDSVRIFRSVESPSSAKMAATMLLRTPNLAQHPSRSVGFVKKTNRETRAASQHGTLRKSSPKQRPGNECGEAEAIDTIYTLGPVGVRGQPTLEEWHDVRNSDYHELTAYNIPLNLIEAARDYRPYASVMWQNEKGEPVAPNEKVARVAVALPVKASPGEFRRFLDDARRKFAEMSEPSLPRTAGEALAECLRTELSRYKQANSGSVRAKKLLPPMTIARIAIDMLETHVLFDRVPGDGLVYLLRELLDADKKKLTSSRTFVARYRAAWILAQKPDIKRAWWGLNQVPSCDGGKILSSALRSQTRKRRSAISRGVDFGHQGKGAPRYHR
jgi:hypothetical protein